MKNRDLTSALGQLLTFLSVHQTGLACAAELLGGPSAAQRVRGLIEALSTAKPHLTRRIARELLLLQRLLCLTDVSDFDTPAAEYFALINPADPAFAEICMLTDGLADFLKDLQTDDSHERGGL